MISMAVDESAASASTRSRERRGKMGQQSDADDMRNGTRGIL